MLLYRVLRAVHRGYPLTVFWIYVALFALSLPFMFIFPLATLMLLGFGLASLVAVVIMSNVLQGLLHFTARRKLHAGICPECGKHSELFRAAGTESQCERCGTVFLPNGAEIVAQGG